MAQFIFTPDNLLDNLEKVGAWSIYGLASIAIKHYFPEIYDKDGYCPTAKEADCLVKMGFCTWDQIVVKYHKEIGYKEFSPTYVNEY